LLQQAGCVAIDRKTVSTAEIYMPVANRADALEGFDGISRRCALCFAIDGALQSLGVPGHHAVGDEREGSGGGDEFLGASVENPVNKAIAGSFAGVMRAGKCSRISRGVLSSNR
jgi:hypothetical protein